MSDNQRGWVGSMVSRLEAQKIKTAQPTRENVAQIKTDQIEETIRRCMSTMASLSAERHGLDNRENECLDQLRNAQRMLIERHSELGIKSEVV